MTLYAPTDVQSIFLPDGCGNPHLIDDADRLVIDCGDCEAAMSAHKHLGWAAAPELVTPTCDERARAERDEASAQKAGIARLNAFANGGDGSTNGALTALVEQNTALMAQNAAMMQQIAGLTAQLTAPPVQISPVETLVVPEVPTSDAVTVTAPKTAKRAPGRPKSAKAE